MRGFWRTVESVFSVMILMAFVLMLSGVYVDPPQETDLSPVGYEKLRELDIRGDLRGYVSSGDHASISSMISIPGYNHSVDICDQYGSCTGYYPDSDNIMVSTYIVSGDSSYQPREVRLYIW